MSIIEKRKQKKMNLVFTTVRENPDYTKTEIKASTGLSIVVSSFQLDYLQYVLVWDL